MRHRLHQMLAVPEVEIAAMVDTDGSQTAETKAKFPELSGVPEARDLGEVLGKIPLDAVMLVTPHKGHREQVVSSFEAGLHVLVEKPLACSVEDAQACIDARDRSGKVGAVSYQRHGMPELQWLRGVLQGGAYGKVLCVSSLLCQDWLNFTSGTWRQDPDVSQGGMLNDSGSHIFDIVLWTTGLVPQAVTCLTDNRATAVEIDSVTSICFEGGALASVCVMGHAPTWHERHVITLESAIVIWTDGKLELTAREGYDSTVPLEWPPATTPDQNFIDAVLGRSEVLAPFECGMDVVRLTRACYESAEKGGSPVSLSETLVRK
jgi:predicted dehydrogenase